MSEAVQSVDQGRLDYQYQVHMVTNRQAKRASAERVPFSSSDVDSGLFYSASVPASFSDSACCKLRTKRSSLNDVTWRVGCQFAVDLHAKVPR